jgi:hypothetical protein
MLPQARSFSETFPVRASRDIGLVRRSALQTARKKLRRPASWSKGARQPRPTDLGLRRDPMLLCAATPLWQRPCVSASALRSKLVIHTIGACVDKTLAQSRPTGRRSRVAGETRHVRPFMEHSAVTYDPTPLHGQPLPPMAVEGSHRSPAPSRGARTLRNRAAAEWSME